MKRTLRKIIVIIAFIAGLSLLLYPLVSNQWNAYRQERLMGSYEEEVAELGDTVDYEAEWERAHAYNDALIPSILPDSFAVAEADGTEDTEYEACLNLLGDGMMGTVEIPKIDVKLPVMHGTDEETLERAAGHLEGSSLPVGGESTHAVISAHRGLPSATLFTDLDQLEIGDHFLLNILDDTLCYEVDQVEVVEPEDTSLLNVEDGEDLVTLLTCTPYGVNTHRLLVRGHRVPYSADYQDEDAGGLPGGASLHTNYALWVIIGLAATAAFVLVLYRIDRRRRPRGAGGADTPEDGGAEVPPDGGNTATEAPDSGGKTDALPEDGGTNTKAPDSGSTTTEIPDSGATATEAPGGGTNTEVPGSGTNTGAPPEDSGTKTKAPADAPDGNQETATGRNRP